MTNSTTDRKYWHNIIRERLKENKSKCLACLRPDDDWEWGTTKINLVKTLNLLNTILKNVPVEAWPKGDGVPYDNSYRINHNNWTLSLFNYEGRRNADLKFYNDDHTAWVQEHSKKKGVFINCDIGGS